MDHKTNKHTDITGAVLAGGKSTRMGRDKALLDLNGRTFIQHVAETLQEVFQRVMVISDRELDYRFLGLPIYADVFKNCGPLAGIHSALKHSTTETVFIVSCDLPLLTPAIVQYVVGLKIHQDATLLATTNNVQPLCGLYQRRCLPMIEKHLLNGQYSVLKCLQEMKTALVSPADAGVDNSGYALMNVNTLHDYQHCLERAAK